jgi:hypothetical protein
MCFCTANRSETVRFSRASESANANARSHASSAAFNLYSAWISASLPVSDTATRSAWYSISRDSARCASTTRRNTVSISERIDHTISDSNQPTQAMRRSTRDRPRRNESSASRFAMM